jgi:hypothetical protein
VKIHPDFINGEWTQAAQGAPNVNPSNLADIVGEYARGDEAEVRGRGIELDVWCGHAVLESRRLGTGVGMKIEFYQLSLALRLARPVPHGFLRSTLVLQCRVARSVQPEHLGWRSRFHRQ